MEMKKVTSSQIAAIGYDVGGKKLRIEFVKGTVYEYENVPKEKFDELIEAESVGKVFSAEIKKHPELYPFKQVA